MLMVVEKQKKLSSLFDNIDIIKCYISILLCKFFNQKRKLPKYHAMHGCFVDSKLL
jgi:hypothetical protein